MSKDTPAADFNEIQREVSRGRSNVLSYLLKLKKCIDADHADLVQALSKRFSEAVIDYLSYGHFRLFTDVHLAAHDAAALENCTELALRFEERYGRYQAPEFAPISAHLEQLALALEVRFEIEDSLLHTTVAC